MAFSRHGGPGRLRVPLAAAQEQLPLLVPGLGRFPVPGGHQACWHLWSPGLWPRMWVSGFWAFVPQPRPELLPRACGLMFCTRPTWTRLPRAHLLALGIPGVWLVPALTLEGKGKELKWTERDHGTTPTSPEELSFPCTRKRVEKHQEKSKILGGRGT